MHWRLRLWLLKNIFDHRCGQGLYRSLQKRSAFHRSPVRFAKKLEQVLKLVDATQEAGVDIANSTIVEIGTGWVPLLPYVMWLLGAEKVYAVDLNRHLLKSAAAPHSQLVAA